MKDIRIIIISFWILFVIILVSFNVFAIGEGVVAPETVTGWDTTPPEAGYDYWVITKQVDNYPTLGEFQYYNVIWSQSPYYVRNISGQDYLYSSVAGQYQQSTLLGQPNTWDVNRSWWDSPSGECVTKIGNTDTSMGDIEKYIVASGQAITDYDNGNAVIYSPETYTEYTLNVGDSITMKNTTTTPSVLVDVTLSNATYESVRIYEGSAPTVTSHTSITSNEVEEIELNEECTYWKITSGTIKVKIPNSPNLYVSITRASTVPNDFNYINPPNRGNYDSSIFGGIQFGIDTLLYTIGFPFIALTYLCERLVIHLNTLLSSIGEMNSAMGAIVSWLPPEYIAIIVIGIIAAVLLKILGR